MAARILLTVLPFTVFPAEESGAQSAEDHPYFTDEFRVREDRGEATISVTRDSAANAVTVTYTTKPSDATEGADYLPVLGQMTFQAGERGPKTFKVPVIDDPEPEEEESVLLLLYDAGGQAIDFSELVIESNEAAQEDADEVPGSSSDSPSSSGSRPGAGNPRTGGPGGARTGPGGGATGNGSGPALAPGEIPTIVLGPQEENGSKPTSGTRNGSAAASASGGETSGPIKLLLGLSIAGVLAGGAALLWLRSRDKRVPAP